MYDIISKANILAIIFGFVNKQTAYFIILTYYINLRYRKKHNYHEKIFRPCF